MKPYLDYGELKHQNSNFQNLSNRPIFGKWFKSGSPHPPPLPPRMDAVKVDLMVDGILLCAKVTLNESQLYKTVITKVVIHQTSPLFFLLVFRAAKTTKFKRTLNTARFWKEPIATRGL